MEKKRGILLIIVLFFSLLLLELISADLSTSEKWKSNLTEIQKNILQKNIQKYELPILNEFAKNNEVVKVIIDLNDVSEIKDFVLNFSEELQNKKIYPEKYWITAEISEDVFFELLQDERVKKIHYNTPTFTYNYEYKLILYIFLIVVFILVILIIYFIKNKINKLK